MASSFIPNHRHAVPFLLLPTLSCCCSSENGMSDWPVIYCDILLSDIRIRQADRSCSYIYCNAVTVMQKMRNKQLNLSFIAPLHLDLCNGAPYRERLFLLYYRSLFHCHQRLKSPKTQVDDKCRIIWN